VALLPLLALVALAIGQALAAGAASAMASHAAEAGAVAVLEGRDPIAAAQAAVPGWSRGRMRVLISGRRVVIEVLPPAVVPGVARLLRARSSADAGAVR
jgi:hypothetical protein